MIRVYYTSYASVHEDRSVWEVAGGDLAALEKMEGFCGGRPSDNKDYSIVEIESGSEADRNTYQP
jgi:hypothetical protein